MILPTGNFYSGNIKSRVQIFHDKKQCKIQSQKQAHEKWVPKTKPQIINGVRSDNFWTGEISKNTLIDEMISVISLMNTETGV